MSDGTRPTLSAVAAKAGVSPSTASLAFSGSGPVSDATRRRVLDAAKALGYAGPDPRARSLRRGRSGIVGVITEERLRDAFHDPIKIALLDGLSEQLGAIGAGVLILTGAGSDAAEAVTLVDAPIDAAVLVGCGPRLDDAIATLAARGIPVVAIEGNPGEGVLEISQDNRDASRRGAEHLRDLGHRRIAVVTLTLDADRTRGTVTPERLEASTARTTTDRLAGVREVFPDAVAYSTAGSYVEEGTIAATALLDVPPAERPTAIVAQSDLLAAGVIRAAETLGLRVPDDLSVLGFDGVRVDGLWPYDLTTLVQPAVEKGSAAGRSVVRMLAGEQAEPAQFSSELRIGNTTAAPGR